MKRKAAIFVLILMLFTTFLYPIVLHAQITDIQQALLDARRDASKDVGSVYWFASGFFCGIFGVAFAYVAQTDVPTAKLLGKSPEYVAFYTDTYNIETRNAKTRASVGGCVTWSVIYLSYLFSLEMGY